MVAPASGRDADDGLDPDVPRIAALIEDRLPQGTAVEDAAEDVAEEFDVDEDDDCDDGDGE
ncbi:MAG: hypothetical protein SGJ23_14035 [Alphaproteobacteria bacterium]|nr:hypothetical protein [Alphaproteobacteria bacterium]